jgi:hypothetical protein
MPVVSCCLLTALVRRLGPAAMEYVMYVHNKTTSAIIGHCRMFPTVFCFPIPKQKMLAKFTLP